jgi:hypothetical protein
MLDASEFQQQLVSPDTLQSLYACARSRGDKRLESVIVTETRVLGPESRTRTASDSSRH